MNADGLLPAFTAEYGQLCGLCDAHGHPLHFPAAFRLARTGQPKGILQIVR